MTIEYNGITICTMAKPRPSSARSGPLAIRLSPDALREVELRCGIPSEMRTRSDSGSSRSAVIEKMIMRYAALCAGHVEASEVKSLDSQERKMADALASLARRQKG